MVDPNSQNDWKTCPPGTFDRMRGQLPAESRQRSIKPVATALVVGSVVAAMIFGLAVLSRNGDAPKGNPTTRTLYCADVIPLLPDYITEKTDPATTLAIEDHLSYCTVCTDKYQELTGRPYVPVVASTPVYPPTTIVSFANFAMTSLPQIEK